MFLQLPQEAFVPVRTRRNDSGWPSTGLPEENEISSLCVLADSAPKMRMVRYLIFESNDLVIFSNDYKEFMKNLEHKVSEQNVILKAKTVSVN